MALTATELRALAKKYSVLGYIIDNDKETTTVNYSKMKKEDLEESLRRGNVDIDRLYSMLSNSHTKHEDLLEAELDAKMYKWKEEFDKKEAEYKKDLEKAKGKPKEEIAQIKKIFKEEKAQIKSVAKDIVKKMRAETLKDIAKDRIKVLDEFYKNPWIKKITLNEVIGKFDEITEMVKGFDKKKKK